MDNPIVSSKQSIPRKPGVYNIRNVTTGKIYVGSTGCIAKRWYCHRCALRHGRHGNSHLQNDWDKYGEASFVLEVVELIEPSLLLEREQWYLDRLFAAGNCYNMSPSANSTLGIKHTPEFCAKNSAAKKGTVISEEQRVKISVALKGRVISAATRAKLSAFRKGRAVSQETRAKISAAQKGKPKARPPISLETRERMRAAALARETKKRAAE